MNCLQDRLEAISGTKLHLKINDNRSTMLSIKWGVDCTRVSMHRIFLQAPDAVMQELAVYLRPGKSKKPSGYVKAFIQDRLRELDYSKKLNPSNLVSFGDIYDLQQIFDQVNKEYFEGKLTLGITWFGSSLKRARSKVTLGLYSDQLKLVKIHRMLDHPNFPDYLVAFVVYHEMLHHVCPGFVDERGFSRIHTREFKRREKEFKYFKEAMQWMREHRYQLFI